MNQKPPSVEGAKEDLTITRTLLVSLKEALAVENHHALGGVLQAVLPALETLFNRHEAALRCLEGQLETRTRRMNAAESELDRVGELCDQANRDKNSLYERIEQLELSVQQGQGYYVKLAESESRVAALEKEIQTRDEAARRELRISKGLEKEHHNVLSEIRDRVTSYLDIPF